MNKVIFSLRNQLLFSAILLFMFSACSSSNGHGQYTKCGTKAAKKKHAFYDSVQYK